MKTVAVRMEWEGQAEEVAVAGEFNGWVTVPLVQEKGDGTATLWSASVPMEPGCYAFKFLVDGEWKTREGDELEEDEKGELNAIIIVEEEDEEEEEAASAEVVEAAAAIKEAVEKVEDDLDVLTLDIGEQTFTEMTPTPLKKEQPSEKSFSEMTSMSEVIAEEKEEATEEEPAKEVEPKVVEEKKADENTATNTEEVEKELKKEPVKAKVVENKENTPKVVKEAPPKRVTRRSILPGTPTLPTTPKVSTPLRASKLDKVAKEAKEVHPDDVESPRRVTRTLLKNLTTN